MNSNEILKRLADLLREEEEEVRKGFPEKKRIALIELARAFDMGIMIGPSLKGRFSVDHIIELYSHGWTKALSLCLDESTHEAGMPLFESDDKRHDWAHSVLQYCGRIALCQLMLDYERQGLVRLIEAKDSRYAFQHVSQQIGLEYIERQDFHWLSAFTQQVNAPQFEELATYQAAIDRMMEERVAPWKEHFMQYSTTPLIDRHYEKMGMLTAQSLHGQDSFDGEDRFGGEPFNLYRATAGVLIGWALKHRDFGSALMRKSKTVKPRNFLTNFTEKKDLVVWIAGALEVSEAQARKALDVLTLSTTNAPHVLKSPSALPPPLISIGSNYLLRTFAGQIYTPFHFMLRELRRQFLADWDRAVGAREERFREDVYTIFGHHRLEKVRRPVELRANDRVVSDVDAVVFDPAARIAGLFQLKWQDAFGASMRERASRMANFTNAAEKWVATVADWMRGKSMEEVGRQIGLSPESSKSLDGVLLFVIGRNFSHFSGNKAYDERAAWGNWAQVLRLTQQKPREFWESPIKWMHGELKYDAPTSRRSEPFEPLHMNLGRVSVSVLPASEEGTA
jgi:hypothetical protein